MSADNWTTCPKCWQRQESAVEKVKRAFYGTVSADEYEVLIAEARAEAKPEEETPLREDWEIGIWDGKFEVAYRAHCRECGWEFSFEHEEVVPDR